MPTNSLQVKTLMEHIEMNIDIHKQIKNLVSIINQNLRLTC